MRKILRFFIYLLNLLDIIINKIFKKRVIGYLREDLEKYCYIKKFFSGKELEFFCPNELIYWRVKTFDDKEPETIAWINSFQNKKNSNLIFWDIGANIGLFSLYAATRFDKCDVVAFEPSTSNLRVLSRNISLNNFLNKIKIVQLPLSNKNLKFCDFSESYFQEGGALNTFNENYNFTGKKVKFENKYKLLGISISELLSKNILEIPDYIKIDVDGIEHLILEGAGKYFNDKKVKSILVEVNEKFEDQFIGVNNFMTDSNFILLKKERNAEFYNNSEFEKMYNYIYVKN